MIYHSWVLYFTTTNYGRKKFGRELTKNIIFFLKIALKIRFLKKSEPKLWNIRPINYEFPNKKLSLKPIAAHFWVLASLVGFWLHLYGLDALTVAKPIKMQSETHQRCQTSAICSYITAQAIAFLTFGLFLITWWCWNMLWSVDFFKLSNNTSRLKSLFMVFPLKNLIFGWFLAKIVSISSIWAQKCFRAHIVVIKLNG